MARTPNVIREFIEYAPLALLLSFFRLLGPRVTLALARPLALAGWLFDIPHRRLAMRQIAACMPELPPRQRRRACRQAFEAAARMGLEVIFMSRALPPEKVLQHIRTPGIERWKPLLDEPGRGAIMATGHFGNWELGQALMSALGYPGVTVVKPFANRFINRRIIAMRSRRGMEMADKTGAFQASVRAVRDGKVLLIAADMYAGRGGLRVNFFGFPASCHRSMALLAVRYRVPLMVGFFLREKGLYRYTMEMTDIITPEQWQQQDDPVLWITERYNQAIEAMVRREPGQFFGWLHRRWRGDDVPWKRRAAANETTDGDSTTAPT